MHSALLSSVTIAATLAALCSAPAPAQGITPQQLMRTRHVTAVAPSDDGAWIAFAVTAERGPDDPVGGLKTTGYLIPASGGEPKELPGAAGLAWRPGTDIVCYVARRDGDRAAQVYGVRAGGGDEQRLTDTPNGVESFAWRPDGAALAYTATDPLPSGRAKNQERGFKPVVHDEDFVHVSLWLYEAGQARQLTRGATVHAFAWGPAGCPIAAAMSPRNLVDDEYMFTRLFVVDPANGQTTKLVDNPGKLGAFAWSPDGKRLAYISAADRNDPHDGMLYVVDRTNGNVKALTDGFHGMVSAFAWRGPERLQVLFDVGVRSYVGELGPDGGELTATNSRAVPAATTFAPFGSGKGFALAGSTAKHAAEVFVTGDDGAMRRLTDSNRWLSTAVLGEQSVRTIRASDGTPIEGIAILPTGHRDGQRHPLVIVAHGGPESHYQDGWMTRYSEPGQVLAAHGFVVWYPNYRSSTGYGVAFAKSDHGDPMGREFEDHLDAIAQFAAEGLVDPKRVGVLGGSYGGYTAAWAATRESAHFAAAVSFVPFTDIRTKWLTTDIPNEFYLVHYQEKWPHEQPGFLADRSPLTWAPQCRTPLLLCGGTADPRVHPSQPFMLYRAVRTATTTPCRYVQYPGEGHGNRLTVNRYDYLLRAVQWFDHYLAEGDHRGDAPPPFDLDYPRW